MDKYVKKIYFLAFILIPLTLFAEIKKDSEDWYEKTWCEVMGGQLEHELPDKSTIDCLTADHAIEMEMAHEWQEGIGQALWFARQTGKKAGMVLVLKTPEDKVHLKNLKETLEHSNIPIQVWELGSW